ncbi:receptor-like protein 12 [Prunus avium]|uniref:Receptor-like protein 12 n=1 Tax=Prunus avium TaxID=42229 RepID=A0A6P5SVX7_PRUAV|nr:receptor-like protein 12 [Prunus avium]
MRIPLLSWLFLVPIYYVSLSFHVFVVSSQCPSDQQSLLLHRLKKSLKFNSTSSKKLAQWKNGSDYCSWEGVSCKNGCVSHLDLSSESISGGLDNSSALFDLRYIENLNLAYNNFNNTQIPSKFDKLTNLSYLNLSNAGFVGQIPIEIAHLTRLVTLDLSTSFYFPGTPSLQLENPNLNVLLGNLSELVELHLDGVNISAHGAQWCQAISSSLPKLRVLSLSTSNISGPFDSSLLKLHSLSVIHIGKNNLSTQVPEFFSNFTNLTSLRLSSSGLYGTFPEKIFLVPTLQTIDLSGNSQLQGSLPEFPKNASLQSLVLNGANFSGQLLPNSIGNLKMLSKIDVPSCNFTGSIPRSMENLTQLIYVDLSWNKFNGSVPFFSMAKNLTLINLSSNLLTGQINSSNWENLTNLENLDLRFNLLNGTIPPSLFSLSLLQKLQLSNNQFSGQLPVFGGGIFLLDTLDLSSNKLEGPIPMSIFNLTGLKILSLSSNNFSGSFPLELLPQLKNLSSLDLSYNILSIDYNDTNSSYSSFPQITTLKLASVNLRRFPDFLRNQSHLSTVDLSQNQIHGEIPNWIWRLNNLSQLNLSCNSLETLEGPLLNVTSSLSVLDLHSNQLRGQIPLFSQFSIYLDYSRNNFNSSIRTDIGDFLSYTIFFSLSSNKFHGSIPVSICNATNLQVLDVSNNSLSGLIPNCLTAISGTLAVLNLRRNNLSGTVPDQFPEHCSLKTLDLNGNQIGGQFPKSLANCTMLEVLNLGNNQIADKFPCLLKNISTLRVLVLRSNKFYGRFGCPKPHGNWSMLQIVDIALNNFSGEIRGKCLRTWQAMMGDEDDAMSELNHLRFEVLKFTEVYYQDAITVTSKGLEMELVKILTVFTSIDFSGNKFNGSIPEEVGQLKSLYGLNLSSNALTGTIPSSLGNLRQLESLDLSKNKLGGEIPAQFANLTFLSFLDLSNNQLVGPIPVSTQFSTFAEESFAGNKGLCGPPLTLRCGNTSGSPDAAQKAPNKVSGIGFDWQSIYTGVGFGVGAGVIVILLILWEEGRNWLEDSIDRILLVILPMMGFTYKTRDEWNEEEEEDFEEESAYIMEDCDTDENESEDKGFRGTYCVFCSKLDMSKKRAIQDPSCTCHLSPPISSSSSSSYSFSP